jgi:hypothetical protein
MEQIRKQRQLFFDDIEKLFCLTGGERALLDLMAKSLSLGNKNSLNMTPKRKKEYAEKIGLKNYRSITNMLKSMEGKHIIKRIEPEEYPNQYTVNPELLFKGNEFKQVKMIMTYNKSGRKLEVKTGE